MSSVARIVSAEHTHRSGSRFLVISDCPEQVTGFGTMPRQLGPFSQYYRVPRAAELTHLRYDLLCGGHVCCVRQIDAPFRAVVKVHRSRPRTKASIGKSRPRKFSRRRCVVSIRSSATPEATSNSPPAACCCIRADTLAASPRAVESTTAPPSGAGSPTLPAIAAYHDTLPETPGANLIALTCSRLCSRWPRCGCWTGGRRGATRRWR